MRLREKYKPDIESVMSFKNHLGGDYWTTTDNRIGKGSPFSARDIAIILSELGYTKDDELIIGLAETIFKTQRPDGRFKISPSGVIYPCHTITALRVLCNMGYSGDKRLGKTFRHLLEIQHSDGGWRCNKVKLGKSPDLDVSNPGVTLEALDAFRYARSFYSENRLDKAVDFLLEHWEVKRPLGPCQFGIGSLFMQTEYPFLRYNLFYYCYTLSFYNRAVQDKRFKEVVSALDLKLEKGAMIIENPNRRLAHLSFCRKGEPSELATKRYDELKSRIQ